MKNTLPLSKSTLFLAFFTIVCSANAAQVLDRVQAVVGNQPILESEVKARFRSLQSNPTQASIMGVNLGDLTEAKTLDIMIEEAMIDNLAGSLGVPSSDTEVNQQIDSIARQNNITRQQLIQSLSSEGIPFNTYARNIKLQIQKRGIIERELRNNLQLDDAELRKAYQERAVREYQIVLLDLPKNRQKELRGAISADQWDELATKHEATDLGWVKSDSLKSDLSSGLASAKTGELIGPYTFGNQSQMVYLRGERVGSEDEFQQYKSQIAAQMQAATIDARFKTWIENKREEMNIVVNKL